HQVADYLRTSRPTAVNLFWALDRMEAQARPLLGQVANAELHERLLREALAIEDEDRHMCRAIGAVGASLIGPGQGVLTHCNAGNGDTANKIGTYGVAVLAKAHGIPFYVAAPSSTFDLSLRSGAAIPIEQRDSREVTHGLGKQIAPDGVKVYNPAFDVTPAHLIAGIITEKGLIQPVDQEN